MAIVQLRWIEFIPRPKKAGLHESGYRYIRLIGVDEDDNRHDLGEWHDHLLIESGCNIDVTPEGTIRIIPWRLQEPFQFDTDQSFFTSTAWIMPDGRFR